MYKEYICSTILLYISIGYRIDTYIYSYSIATTILYIHITILLQFFYIEQIRLFIFIKICEIIII